MSPRTVLRLARPLRAAIGAHHRLRYDDCPADYWDRYAALREASDAAVRQVVYLIRFLADRHAAVLLARACGMPGYINLR